MAGSVRTFEGFTVRASTKVLHLCQEGLVYIQPLIR